MLFYSPLFLFLFMPLVYLSFYLVTNSWKNSILLSFSLFFYFWAEPIFSLIAVCSALIDFFICRQIFNHLGKTRAKLYLILGIILNVGMLVYFKYMDFFIVSTNSLLKEFNIQALPLLNIALPIGVSFIVFEKITYLVDVYRKKGPPANSVKEYLVYIFLFPKLLAGPIVKYHDISAQLANRQSSLDDFFIGFRRFLLGFVKKVLLADTVGELANTVFALPPNELGFTQAWLGVICFTLQIYLDFSAYSDMAIGLARMFGFRLLENFNTPYIATNFTDFWRRWHISLSTWIKEYLYFSLGGNRVGVVRTYVNLWICFLISGLWHGASWTFVLWGAYNGLFLVLDKLFWLRLSNNFPKTLNVALTLFFVMIGWVIFRATSLSQINNFFLCLFNPWKVGLDLYITYNIWAAIAIGILISLIPLPTAWNSFIKWWQASWISLFVENWALSLLSFFAITRIVTSTFNPFLYFRF